MKINHTFYLNSWTSKNLIIFRSLRVSFNASTQHPYFSKCAYQDCSFSKDRGLTLLLTRVIADHQGRIRLYMLLPQIFLRITEIEALKQRPSRSLFLIPTPLYLMVLPTSLGWSWRWLKAEQKKLCVGLLLVGESVEDIQLSVSILHFLNLQFAILSKLVLEQGPPMANPGLPLGRNYLLAVPWALYACQQLPGLTEEAG